MMAQIPLTDDERAAVEDGTAAVERLLEHLTDVATPAGPTPRQLTDSMSFTPLTTLDTSANRRRDHNPSHSPTDVGTSCG